VQHSGKSFQHFHFTKGDIQARCNQLTRELHATGEAHAADRVLEESRNKNNGGRVTQQGGKATVQTGIEAFLKVKAKAPKNGIKPKRQASPEQACYSDVEVVDSPYRRNSDNGTTKHEDGGPSKKAETKSFKSSHSSEEQVYSDCEIIDSPPPSPTKKGTKKDVGDDAVCYDVEHSPAQTKGKRKDPGSDDSSASLCSEKKRRAS
jgi:hypothetical protein